MWPFDSNKQDVYQEYAQAYDTGDYSNLDRNEAQANVQQFAQNAPPDVQQRIFEQHFAQMSPNQRAQLAQEFPPDYFVDPNDSRSMAQSMARMSQERPNMLQRILNHPVLLAGSVGLAAMIAKHMQEHRAEYTRY